MSTYFLYGILFPQAGSPQSPLWRCREGGQCSDCLPVRECQIFRDTTDIVTFSEPSSTTKSSTTRCSSSESLPARFLCLKVNQDLEIRTIKFYLKRSYMLLSILFHFRVSDNLIFSSNQLQFGKS